MEREEWLVKIAFCGLSLEEKGMLTVLCEMNPEETLTTEVLQQKISDRTGTIIRMLHNLERKGILLRMQERDEHGQFGRMEWKINVKAIQ